MIRKYILPLLALFGLIFAIRTVIAGSKEVPAMLPPAQPSKAPYPAYIAGAGIIEAETENIAVGTPLSGIVKEIKVAAGQKVHKNEPLFLLDDRNQKAETMVRRAALNTAQEKLIRLKSLPRIEDVAPMQARVNEAETALAEARSRLSLVENLSDKRAVSQEEVTSRRYAVKLAEDKLAETQTQLTQIKAGGWAPDIAVAEAEIKAAAAQIKAIETEIERLIIRSPIDGEVLQINIRTGEYAQAGVLSKPLMVVGNLEQLHVRIDIDENDAWRFKDRARAIAFVRSNNDLKTDLVYRRTEPYVVPKRSLSGDSTERVDTRVLQVIYSFDRHRLPVYVGQQMDVFIEAAPIEDKAEGTKGVRGEEFLRSADR
ncbi:MAG: secretion protein HlyD [Candidatus Schekmanbacteria bacterium]|nr:secretion protein HlyD [Candidatus Schekmanbacteria bacterium]